MTTTPADTLRTAAQLLRDRATAKGMTPGPWQVHLPNGYPQAVHGDGPNSLFAEFLDEIDEAKPHAPFVALMHPGVALALAEWLESTASTVDAVAEKYEPEPDAHWLAPALTVARRVLGETTTTTGAQTDSLRDRLATAVRTVPIKYGDGIEPVSADEAAAIADAVMTVLPTGGDRAAEVADQAQQGAGGVHACGNCDGIDPDSCLTNPHRPAPAVTEEPTPHAVCDLMFEDGRQCAKTDGHRPPGSDDPHVPERAATKEPK